MFASVEPIEVSKYLIVLQLVTFPFFLVTGVENAFSCTIMNLFRCRVLHSSACKVQLYEPGISRAPAAAVVLSLRKAPSSSPVYPTMDTAPLQN